MKCPNCQTINPDNAKFCMNCGHQLTEIQAIVQTQNLVDSNESRLKRYMPRDLKNKLESTRQSDGMQGERRVVTTLFCDVVGSTVAAEQLDPEDWTEIMNGAFEHLIEPVYQYEGTVARLMGDAILAFFGAPIAHEDDPQRAVLAGLEITRNIQPYSQQVKDRYGVDFDVRVGINTGLVVIGEVGSDLAVEYTAMGDAVNLASRMEQTAEPGSVQISSNTHKLIEPLFEFETIGRIQVKGRSEPVRAFRVLRPKAEPGRLRGLAGLESPLVGRDAEMKTLQEAVSGLLQGRGQVVSVMGEAGLGKSRLVTELHLALVAAGQIAADQGEDNNDDSSQLGWHEGRSLSYETSTPYAPFVDLLTSYFGLGESQTDAQKYAHLKSRIETIFPDRVTDIAPFIATLLEIQLPNEDFQLIRYMEPPYLRQKIFNAIIEFVERLAEVKPLVLVLDDVHWIDPTSLDLLEQLLPLTERANLMMVTLFRPVHSEPSWRYHEMASQDYAHRYTTVTLEPLDEDNSRQLVANLLHIEGLPEEIRALILKKAEGNPFYVEEVIRSLLDSGLVVRDNGHWRATQTIVDIAVPDTLAGVITTRLDRLDDVTRQVAQTAAVIGRQFEYDTLAAVYDRSQALDQSITELQRRELIREKSRTPKRVFLFKHALTQETAHASLLNRKCQEIHLRVAEYLENTDTGRANDIARHFMDAKQGERALPYLIEAGMRANHASSTSEAIEFFTQALEISKQIDDSLTMKQSYEGLGSALTFTGDIPGAMEIYQTMLQTGLDLGDEPMQVSAHNKLGFLNGILLEDFQTAESHLANAEQMARQNQDVAGLAELHMVKCGVCTATGDLDGAIAHLGESVQLGRDLDAEEPLLFGLAHSANTLTFLARLEEARNSAQEAYQKAEQLGNRRYLSELQTFPIAYNLICAGDLSGARQTAEEGLELAAQIGFDIGLWQGNYTLGQISKMQGDYQRALYYLRTALEIGEADGMAYPMMMPMSMLGTLYMDISEKLYNQSMAYHNRVITLVEQPSGAAWGSSAWVELGFCYLATGELARADEYFHKGLTVKTTMMHLLRPKLLVGAANVALAKDDFDLAAKHIQEARAFAEERGMKDQYPLIAFTNAKLLTARGKVDQALEQFNLAETLAQEMNMRPLVWQARAAAGQTLFESGRNSEADLKRRQAQVIIEEIGSLIDDETLRSQFLESASKKTWGTVLGIAE